jgi:hypothetical protein
MGHFIYLHFKCYPPSHFPLHKPPIPPLPLILWGCPPTHPPTYSHLTSLAFPYIGASNLYRTKGLLSHWCQIRQSSATYESTVYSKTHIQVKFLEREREREGEREREREYVESITPKFLPHKNSIQSFVNSYFHFWIFMISFQQSCC